MKMFCIRPCLLRDIACCVCQNVHHFHPFTVKPLAREDTVQTNFLPHKSFPEKSPVNGTSEQPPKTNTGAPPVSSYNRYAPKPYTTSAKPFARMFDSPKFNHNLLPNDKTEIAPKVSRCWPVVKLVWHSKEDQINNDEMEATLLWTSVKI